VGFLGNEKNDLQGNTQSSFFGVVWLVGFFRDFALLTKIKIKGKKSKTRAKEKE